MLPGPYFCHILHLFPVAQYARNHWHNITGISSYSTKEKRRKTKIRVKINYKSGDFKLRKIDESKFAIYIFPGYHSKTIKTANKCIDYFATDLWHGLRCIERRRNIVQSANWRTGSCRPLRVLIIW